MCNNLCLSNGFDKSRWSCSWNSAEIRLSYQLYLHTYIIMLCLKGKVLRLAKTVHKTLPEPSKHGV